MRLRGSGVALVVGVGAAIHLAALAITPRAPILEGDAPSYVLLAHNLVAGHGFSLSEAAPWVPTVFRTPGYPLFLAAVTAGFRLPLLVAGLAQVVLLLAVAGLVTWQVERWGGSRAVAVAAGLIAAALPPLESFALFLVADMVGLFLAFAAALVLDAAMRRDRPGLWLASGLASGAATLVRIEYVVLLGLLPLMAWLAGPKRGRGRAVSSLPRLAAGLLGVAVILGPWALRNERVFGRPAVLGELYSVVPSGYAKWALTWMDHPRYLQDTYWDVWSFDRYRRDAFPERAFASAGEREVVDSLLTSVPGTKLVGSPADTVFAALARQRLREHPIGTLLLVPVRRIAITWAYLPVNLPLVPAFAPRIRGPKDLLAWNAVVMLLCVALTLALLVGGLAGAARVLVLRMWPAVPFAVLFLWRVLLLGWLVLPEPRYALPAMAPSVLLVAVLCTPRRRLAGAGGAHGSTPDRKGSPGATG